MFSSDNVRANVSGIIYDVIVEPPSVGSTTDEHGHSRPVQERCNNLTFVYILFHFMRRWHSCRIEWMDNISWKAWPVVSCSQSVDLVLLSWTKHTPLEKQNWIEFSWRQWVSCSFWFHSSLRGSSCEWNCPVIFNHKWRKL